MDKRELMHLDVLAFGAHPDDVEISAAGSVARLVAEGRKVGIVDLTRGELGTRGSAAIRDEEAARAAQILGVSVRENLNLPDGFFQGDKDSILKAVDVIRQYRPSLVLCNAPSDRHPDHGRGAALIHQACFLAGLPKIESNYAAHRPALVLNYVQDFFIEPNVVWDVSDYMELKMESLGAYASQFYNPQSTEKATPISGPEFLEHIKGRALQFGRYIGVKYAEGFVCSRPIGTQDIMTLF